MDRSPGFGPARTDSFALLRLGFPTAPYLKYLTLPVPAARRTVLQKVRGRAYKALPQLVDTGFQVEAAVRGSGGPNPHPLKRVGMRCG